MWWAFRWQRLAMKDQISEISAAELSSLLVNLPHKLIIFDLRERNEIDLYPYGIPGALLTANVSLHLMLPAIPPQSTVVFYAADRKPIDFDLLHPFSLKPNFHLLKGGLRAWWEAHLPLERVLCLRRPSSVSRGG